jgi:hypothetical protein
MVTLFLEMLPHQNEGQRQAPGQLDQGASRIRVGFNRGCPQLSKQIQSIISL